MHCCSLRETQTQLLLPPELSCSRWQFNRDKLAANKLICQRCELLFSEQFGAMASELSLPNSAQHVNDTIKSCTAMQHEYDYFYQYDKQ